MALEFEDGLQTLKRIHKALMLPDDFPLRSFSLEVGIDDIPEATIKFLINVKYAEALGEVLGHYRLEPRDS